MSNKILILILLNIKIKEKLIAIRISQEFPLLFILYLFYAAELLETYNSTNDKLSISSFINDIMLLVYGYIIKGNCQILKSAHNKYLN